jgi:hypothetical protein
MKVKISGTLSSESFIHVHRIKVHEKAYLKALPLPSYEPHWYIQNPQRDNDFRLKHPLLPLGICLTLPEDGLNPPVPQKKG